MLHSTLSHMHSTLSHSMFAQVIMQITGTQQRRNFMDQTDLSPWDTTALQFYGSN